MKLGIMINVYGILGEATTTSLEVSEVLKILDMRMVMRPYVDEWNAYYRDIQEKGKSWETMTPEQKAELDKAVNSRLDKEIEADFERLTKESVAKLIKENGFKMREIDLLGIMAE